MDNTEKDIYETNENAPIEAEDLQMDENASGENGEQEVFEPGIRSEENAKLRSELEEQRDKYMRLLAEFDNFKRRNARERIELIQTAGKEVITSLLQVLDDCDRAEKQIQETSDPDQIKDGVQLVFNKLRKTLNSKGLKPMESINTDFDVEKHEAITEIPVDDKKLKGKVVDEIEKGYYLNDKLIRFAKVIVGK
ncbi:MAG: nucleotide exchange factor GrpE [Bacteroidota bacterium]|nr:nucleotide exchange factor GrpE [Bacteroidota bacterium]